ncbi:MAG: TIGR02147 family protein [Pseudobdellovibrionaceae bacterium]
MKQENNLKLRPRLKQEFRTFLGDELASRCERNPNYSLRSFAKSLDISPSALSALLKGKRPFTHKMKMKLGLKMGLELKEIENLISSHHGNRSRVDASDSPQYQQITTDTFSIISQPHHYALLELVKTQDFIWDDQWISERLDISVFEVRFAAERLERIGLLARDEHGVLYDTTNGFSSDLKDGLTSEAQKRFQQKAHGKAISAIENIPLEYRDNTSITMAFNMEDLPKAKKLIKEFRRNFCEKLEAKSHLDQVYQLTISFIPLSNISGVKK